MCCRAIYNCLNCFPTPCHKSVVSTVTLITITAIAISIIGLSGSPHGHLHAITHLGKISHGFLFCFSVFAFILELVWIKELYRNRIRYIYETMPDADPDLMTTIPTLVHLDKGALSPIEVYDKNILLRKQPENQTRPQPFADISYEMCYTIFFYLSPQDLGRCRQINKEWQCMANLPGLWNSFDLRKISPLINVLDQKDWASAVDLSSFQLECEEPELDKRALIPFLFKLLSSIHIEEDKGITIFTVPKGLSYPKLTKIKDKCLPALEMTINHLPREGPVFHETVDHVIINKTYRIIISNSGIPETNFVYDKKKLLNTKGFNLPETIELLAFLILRGVCSYETYKNEDHAFFDSNRFGITGTLTEGLNIDCSIYIERYLPATLTWKVPEIETHE